MKVKRHNSHPNALRRSAYAADTKAQHGPKETETLANEKLLSAWQGVRRVAVGLCWHSR